MRARGRLGLIFISTMAALAISSAPAVAKQSSVAAVPLPGPAVMAQESTCPDGLRAVVPDPAALKAEGPVALIASNASAQAKAEIAKVPFLQKAIAGGYKWTPNLGCHITDVTASTSANWSGYEWSGVDYDHTYYQSAFLDWLTPTPESGVVGTTRRISIWPGLGSGDASYDQLEQAGTETVSGPAGYQGTYAWVELFPHEPEVQITSLPVEGGDYMSADVIYDTFNDSAEFILCNVRINTCTDSTQTLGFSGSDSIIAQQAEWILERSSVGAFAELGNFGTEYFFNAGGSQVEGGTNYVDPFRVSNTTVAGRTSSAIRMLSCNGAQYLTSSPSSLDSDGDFSITWQHYGSVESC